MSRRGKVGPSLSYGGGAAIGDDHDTSFMDTEPLDTSVLNTEPLDASVLDTEPMTVDDGSGEDQSDDEDEDEESNDENEEDAKSIASVVLSSSDESELLVTSGSEDDDDSLADFRGKPVPPPIDITMTPSYEVKRIYSDLIDSCRGFDDSSINSSDILETNITTGDALFRQMEVTLSESLNETSKDSSRSNKRTMLGSTASELYLACQHTRVCSAMLKQAVKNVGIVACAFKFEEFLDSLKGAAVDQVGGYSVLLACRKLAYTYSSASYSAQNFHTMFGCLEKDDLVRAIQPPTPKETKVRLPRKKEEPKEEDVTQKEVMNQSTQPKNDEAKNDTPDGLAKDIIKTLKVKYKQQETPQNMLEIAYADTVPDVLSRLFGVAFVVRDGHVGLGRADDASGLAATTAITMRPERPPDKATGGKDDKRRNQYIASFSANFLKTLVKTRENSNK